MIKVAALASDTGGCAWYRIHQPLRRLEARGEIALSANVVQKGGRMMPAITASNFEEADVVIVQKAGGEDLLPVIQKYARKVVYEADDDLESITRENPCYAEEIEQKPGLIQRMRRNAGAARMITTTTPHLADVMRRWNRVVRVVPNGVDPLAFTPPARSPGAGVRIGYLASRNHVEDVRLLYRPLREICDAYPEVTVVLGGAFYADLKRHLGDRMEYHAGVGVTEYSAFARSLRLDIGLAPLVDSRFARSKSPLKWMEYSALGCPTVASDVEPYSRVIESGVTGLLARSADAWLEQLSGLIERADARREMARLALADVHTRFTVDHSADAWLSVLREVAA